MFHPNNQIFSSLWWWTNLWVLTPMGIDHHMWSLNIYCSCHWVHCGDKSERTGEFFNHPTAVSLSLDPETKYWTPLLYIDITFNSSNFKQKPPEIQLCLAQGMWCIFCWSGLLQQEPSGIKTIGWMYEKQRMSTFCDKTPVPSLAFQETLLHCNHIRVPWRIHGVRK